MKLTLKSKIIRNNKVIFKDVEGVVYILDHRNATIHTLNETASFLWRKLRTAKSIDKLSRTLCNSYEVKKTKATKDIKDFLQKYLKQDFLVIV